MVCTTCAEFWEAKKGSANAVSPNRPPPPTHRRGSPWPWTGQPGLHLEPRGAGAAHGGAQREGGGAEGLPGPRREEIEGGGDVPRRRGEGGGQEGGEARVRREVCGPAGKRESEVSRVENDGARTTDGTNSTKREHRDLARWHKPEGGEGGCLGFFKDPLVTR